jgi:hypothetical protein
MLQEKRQSDMLVSTPTAILNRWTLYQGNMKAKRSCRSVQIQLLSQCDIVVFLGEVVRTTPKQQECIQKAGVPTPDNYVERGNDMGEVRGSS